MQTTWKNQVYGLEPYEELQWSVYGDSQADALSLTQSRPRMDPSSSQNQKQPKKSLFSRKPVKRTSSDAVPFSPSPSSPPGRLSAHDSSTEPLHSPGPLSREPSSDTLSPILNRSIIPESLKELPSWYHTEGELAATARQFRGRYPIRNPVGPRFYKNVHLEPPNRPASVFSPSFPPMSAEPPTMAAAPSRTPSGSPLPTPSSSQTRIPEPSLRVRTRKISNTAPDNVDLLDASDPYGTNWHHESPYDGLGLNGDRAPVSPDAPDPRPPPRSRSRISSLGTGSHHRTTTPSPLSQSTSAIPPHSVDQDPPSITRKLTKRRKPFEGLFGSASSPAPAPDTLSVTPSVTPSTRTVTNRFFKRSSMFKSASTTSIPQTISNASIVPSEKRQKHSSMFGRFARRLSIMRRVVPGHSRAGSLDSTNEWPRGDRQSLQVTDRTSVTTRPPSVASPISPSENRQSTRMPLPQAETPWSPYPTPLGMPEDEQTRESEQTQDPNRDSISSLEVSYSVGRLTIANPDTPSSTDNSPANQSHPLPANRTTLAPTRLSQSMEKPLPTPAPPSSPLFLDIPKFESLSALMSPTHGSATTTTTTTTTTRTTSPSAPVTRTPSKEGRKYQSAPPSSFPVQKLESPSISISYSDGIPTTSASAPVTHTTLKEEGGKSRSIPPSSLPVPIPRAVSNNERRSSAVSPPSATPVSTHTSTGQMSVLVPPPAVDDSPLSRASIIANPPTPSVEPNRIDHAPATVQTMAPLTIHPSVPSPVITPIVSSPHVPSPREPHMPLSRDAQPTKNQGSRLPRSTSSVRSRETETFHLVRSPSAGTTQQTGQSIIVAGEQWNVVGGSSQRSRTKKEKDDARRANPEPERRDSKRQDRTIEKVSVPGPSKSESRKLLRARDSSSNRKHSSQVEGKDQVRRSPTTPTSRSSGMLTPTPEPERRPSQSQARRPTSELTPAAEMNALRAREVWEMDRLWKGRSVAYGLEGPQVVYAQSIGDVGSTASVNGTSHGSTHTSYKIQQGFPFPTTTSGVYSPSTLAPSPQLPPLQAPQSISQTMQGALYDFPSGVRSYPDLANIPSIGSPESTPTMQSRNPLPPPPRQSTFRPGPVPASFIEKDDGAKAEYWSKYAGVVSPMR